MGMETGVVLRVIPVLIISLPHVVSLYLSFLSRNKEAMLGKGPCMQDPVIA